MPIYTIKDAPMYLYDLILRPFSAASLSPLRSSDRLDLFVPTPGTVWLNRDPLHT